QRNHSIEPPVHSLRVPPPAFLRRLFPPALAVNRQTLFGPFNSHVVLRQSRQVRVDHQIISRLPHFYRWHPVKFLLQTLPAMESASQPKRPVDVLRESPHQRNRAHRKKFPGAHGKNRWQVAPFLPRPSFRSLGSRQIAPL